MLRDCGARAGNACFKDLRLHGEMRQARGKRAYTHRSLLRSNESPALSHELVSRRGLVDTTKTLLLWTGLIGNLAGGASEDVSTDHREVA